MKKEQFIPHVYDVAEKIGLPPVAVKEILTVADIVFAIPDARIGVEMLNGALFAKDGGVNKAMKKFAETLPCSEDQFALFFCLYNSYTAKQVYIDHEIPLDIFYDSMNDILVWGEVCRRRTGRWGMLDYGWVQLVLKVELFKLGRFQFRLHKYHGNDFEVGGVKLKDGDPIIDFHIPEGDSVTKDKRMDAYKRAYKFFGQTGLAVFACDSWLFYDKHREFLSPKSNIIDFMNDFKYAHHKEYDRPQDMWRIFGHRRSYDNVDELPQNTGLQRAYAKWWGEHHTMGEAYGLFAFDGENILNF